MSFLWQWWLAVTIPGTVETEVNVRASMQLPFQWGTDQKTKKQAVGMSSKMGKHNAEWPAGVRVCFPESVGRPPGKGVQARPGQLERIRHTQNWEDNVAASPHFC